MSKVDSAAPERVSVVLCSFNGAAHIAEQLQTLAEQTRQPDEIVVSDDGSTDRTLAEVEAFRVTQAIPITVVRNEDRLGFAENFLKATRAATGDVIAFCDQDDRWTPTKIDAQLHAMKRHRAVLVVHAVRFISADGSPMVGGRRKGRLRIVSRRRSMPWGNFLGFTMVFRKELLDRIPAEMRGLDPHSLGSALSHDRWIYFLATTFGRVVVLPDTLADYRQHERQLYGGLVPRSIGERLRTKLQTGEEQAEYLSTLASYRAELLRRHVGEPALGRSAYGRWSRVSRHYSRSARLYRSEGIGAMSVMAENIVTGVYLPFLFGGLGRKQLLQDGLLFAYVLTNRGRPRSDGRKPEGRS